MNIYLIGFMGCGKSTTGRKLAALMGWPFCDTDRVIEESEKKTVSEIFRTDGEEYFRQKERAVLEELTHKKDMVVACGGGMPCHDDNITLMRQSGVVVYLKMPPEALMIRLRRSKTERPLLKNLSDDQLYGKIVTLLDERSKYFDQAHFDFSGINVNLNGLRDRIFAFLSKTE